MHKYTITALSNEDQISKITQQIERKIDVIKASYYSDDQIFIREIGLYKLSTPITIENPEISKIIRQHNAAIVEVNPTYSIVIKSGMTEEIMSLYYGLNDLGCVLQYTRSGRIAITKSHEEHVSAFLEAREKENNGDGE